VQRLHTWDHSVSPSCLSCRPSSGWRSRDLPAPAARCARSARTACRNPWRPGIASSANIRSMSTRWWYPRPTHPSGRSCCGSGADQNTG
jgi:hypothetical protein